MTSGLSRRLQALRRLPARPARDLAYVVLAQWQLLRARLAILVTRRGRLLETAALATAVANAPSDAESLARARKISLAVDRAADYGLFRPTCLVRSIALDRMLRQEGVSGGVVRIGARSRAGRTEMHAWIEVGGAVVGERPDHIGTFTPLHDFTVVGRV